MTAEPNSIQKQYLGVFLGICSAACFSTKAIMVKYAYMYGADTVFILFLRYFFSFPIYIFLAWYYSKQASTPISKTQWGWIIFLGFIGYYVSSLFDFTGLTYISASLERLILFIYPTLIVVLNTILFGSKLQRKDYFALILTYIGIFFIYLGNTESNTENLIKGSILVFACAVTYAFYIVGSGKLIPIIGSQRYTAYAMIVSCISVMIHQGAVNGIPDFSTASTPVLWIGFAMAIIATVIPSLTLAQSIKLIGTDKSSIIATLGPVFTIALANYFLNEPFTIRQAIGTLFIITGVWFVSKK
ncbi:DMT family transporter [Cytophaga aurantiaca]|uniref:DMT family transporter n=1 Tax=Cytophaga aurantiaca TaxID=29530 RepID=UPI000364A68A|nr:DMT family transporter [Cytophaga aurantiaca]